MSRLVTRMSEYYLQHALRNLEMARFTRRYPVVLETLMKQMLSLVHVSAETVAATTARCHTSPWCVVHLLGALYLSVLRRGSQLFNLDMAILVSVLLAVRE
eukprot:GHRR01027867.1.p1 GENE.GHRR01027867.1~~GHRR01027867.1.p1  ORF type:complete len:101 (+),score=24.62 GHRR01027867.1:586-888(+)